MPRGPTTVLTCHAEHLGALWYAAAHPPSQIVQLRFWQDAGLALYLTQLLLLQPCLLVQGCAVLKPSICA